jgi:hypothetical protein
MNITNGVIEAEFSPYEWSLLLQGLEALVHSIGTPQDGKAQTNRSDVEGLLDEMKEDTV